MTAKIIGSPKLSRILITIATLVYGFVTLLVDLTETHVFHPDWTPHARFHMVWLISTNCALAIVALSVMWFSRFDAKTRIRAAGFIGTNTGLGGTGNRVDFKGFERWIFNKEGLIKSSIGKFDEEDYNRQLNK